MASIGISEFTFGFAFLHEQTLLKNVRAAPILPSLRKEQEEGWDAHLPVMGGDYYYQFKLSNYLYGKNAKYISDGTYNDPYYRISLHPANGCRQHQRLRLHSQNNPNTFYVAPEFNELDDFNKAFSNQQITSKSRLIPINECDDISDNEPHYITFQTGKLSWLQRSERKYHEKSLLGKNLNEFYLKSNESLKKIDKKFSIELFNKIKSETNRILAIEKEVGRHPISEITSNKLIKEEKSKEHPFLLDYNPEESSMKEILLKTSEILSIYFGLTLVLVGHGNENKKT